MENIAYDRRPFSLTDLDNVVITRKSLMPLLVTSIVGGTVMVITVVFLILFLTRTPMEINTVMYEYGDEPYMSFFIWFFSIAGTVIGISAIIGLLFSGSYKPYMFIGRDAYANRYAYVDEKKEAYYITDDYVIIHHKASDFADKTKDPIIVKRMKLTYLLFDYPLDNVIITAKKQSLKIKCSVVDRFYQYTFPSRSLQTIGRFRYSVIRHTHWQNQYQHLMLCRIEHPQTVARPTIPTSVLNLAE